MDTTTLPPANTSTRSTLPLPKIGSLWCRRDDWLGPRSPALRVWMVGRLGYDLDDVRLADDHGNSASIPLRWLREVYAEVAHAEPCCDASCAAARALVAPWDRPHRDTNTCASCGSPLEARP